MKTLVIGDDSMRHIGAAELIRSLQARVGVAIADAHELKGTPEQRALKREIKDWNAQVEARKRAKAQPVTTQPKGEAP